MALSACITAFLFQLGIPMGLALFLGLLTGLFLGWFNGWIVTKFELPPIIVTIGTLALYRGIAMILMGDKSIGRFPEWFVGCDTRYIGSTFIPYPLVIFIILAAILWLILNFTLFGRHVFAIGTNEQAAKYSGIRVKRLKLILFSLSGLFSAFAGIVMMSRLGVVRYDLADGGILDIVTITLLGGVDINGGRGNIGGTVIALFTLIVLRLGLSVANVKIENQLAIIGSLLILSITLSNYIYSKRNI
jgi:rhamnose transport system permease protein